MSEAEFAWRELQRRASESKFSGITSTSDDLLAENDLGEGVINPNAAAGGAGAGAGGGMPPMMMGGMGGMGGGQGAGGGGLGGGGLGAAQGAAGGAYAPGARYVPGSAPMKDQNAAAGAMPSGSGIPSGGIPGGAMPSGGGDAGGEEPVEEETPEEELEEEPAEEPTDEPCDGEDPEDRDGFTYEEEQMAEIAELWNELSGLLEKMKGSMPAPASLGFAENARFCTDELASDTERWTEQAIKEFLLISHQMMSAARAYSELEDEGVFAVHHQEDLR